MHDQLQERSQRLRQFFNLSPDVELLSPKALIPEIPAKVAEHLRRYNLEWHIIPSEEAVPFDTAYVARMYPMCPRDFTKSSLHRGSCQEALNLGHHRHQGMVIAVESTQKPHYLPNGRQFYGSHYGVDPTLDPFADYLGRAGFTNGTRFSHNYQSMREFVRTVNEDWKKHGLMPEGFRLTVCPPAIFNLVGLVFHLEWSDTESMELGFYRDDQGNAQCYAIGCNAPDDFSFIHNIETNSDWSLLGFRTVLVPENL